MDEFGFEIGDILVCHERWILIYAGYRDSSAYFREEIRHAIVYYALMNLESGYADMSWPDPRPGIGYIETNRDMRFATNEEIMRFYNRLKMMKCKWDYKNKAIVYRGINPKRYEEL